MRRLSLAFLFSLIPIGIFAQDDLLNLLNINATPEINFATATFKSTRIMNGHSIERMPPDNLISEYHTVSEQSIQVRMSSLVSTRRIYISALNMEY